MFLTTTNGFEGKTIKEYKGVVFGEAIASNSVWAHLSNPLIGFTGGRATAYEQEFITIRTSAINEMIDRAKKWVLML